MGGGQHACGSNCRRRPSNETTAARASSSKLTRGRAVSASTLDLVRRANWYGLVAWWKLASKWRVVFGALLRLASRRLQSACDHGGGQAHATTGRREEHAGRQQERIPHTRASTIVRSLASGGAGRCPASARRTGVQTSRSVRTVEYQQHHRKHQINQNNRRL